MSGVSIKNFMMTFASETIPGDIVSPEFVKTLVRQFGRLDGLVHAAGIGTRCPVGMLTDDYINSVMRANYHSFLVEIKSSMTYGKNLIRNLELYCDVDASATTPHLTYDGVDMINPGTMCVRAENSRTGLECVWKPSEVHQEDGVGG